jgi:hypothetical protein
MQKDQRRVAGLLATGIFILTTCQLSNVVGAEIPSCPSQWETTLDAAKKEGKVNIYMYRYGKILDVFRSDHPEIRPYLLTGTGAQITTKILAERRAGRYITDVIGLGSSNYRILHQQAKILDPIQPALMLPEVLDVSRWYGGKHRYLDPDGKFVFAYMANASSGQLYYNTGLVNPKEFTSYYDLFKPKWNGKIVALDPARGRKSAQPCSSFIIIPSLARRLFGSSSATKTLLSAAIRGR